MRVIARQDYNFVVEELRLISVSAPLLFEIRAAWFRWSDTPAYKSQRERMTTKKVPGDRLLLGLLSAFRTLVVELSNRGVLDQDEFARILQETADAHRKSGDPNRLADAIGAISRQISSSVPGPHSDIH